jgi:hypothetical protein
MDGGSISLSEREVYKLHKVHIYYKQRRREGGGG